MQPPRFEKDLLLDAAKYERERSMNALYSKYDLATTTSTTGGLGGLGNAYDRARAFSGRAGPSTTGLYGALRGLQNSSRSWHPSPHASQDLSDEEAALVALAEDRTPLVDQPMSIEEKAAKVRAEIKRRRARLGDAAGRGGLYRHYSLDDYNLLDSSRDAAAISGGGGLLSDSEYLSGSAAVDPLLLDSAAAAAAAASLTADGSYDLGPPADYHRTDLYPLASRSAALLPPPPTKEKYYGDE